MNVKCIVARPWGGETPPDAIRTLLDLCLTREIMERRLKPIQDTAVENRRVACVGRIERAETRRE